MARILLGKDGPASFTYRGFTVLRGEPRDDVPLEIVRAMEQRYDHVRATYTPGEQEVGIVEDTGDVDDGRPKRPGTRAGVNEAILEAMDQLDVDTEGHYNKDGKPDARALTSILGWQVTKQDRDAALAAAAGDTARPAHTPSNITIVRKGAKPAAAEPLLDSGAEEAEQAELISGSEVEDEDEGSKDGAVTV